MVASWSKWRSCRLTVVALDWGGLRLLLRLYLSILALHFSLFLGSLTWARLHLGRTRARAGAVGLQSNSARVSQKKSFLMDLRVSRPQQVQLAVVP